jgi:DNA-binding transcriptional MerR regulator
MTELRIGGLAQVTGTSAPTIRYYESIGLLPAASRRAGGQRVYADGDVERLSFIRRCRDFGFSIEQVQILVSLMRDRQRSCFEARDLAQDHLNAVRLKLAELRALERSIAAFVADCHRSCAGGAGRDCVVLSGLGSNRVRKVGRAKTDRTKRPLSGKMAR